MKKEHLQPVESSNISEIGFDQDTEELYVRFKSGKVYKYTNVPFSIYTALMEADSIGSFFHKEIRTAFDYQQLEEL